MELTIGKPATRGKVSRVSVCRGGELSVTVRFGLEELEAARRMLPGTLVSVRQLEEKRPDPLAGEVE